MITCSGTQETSSIFFFNELFSLVVYFLPYWEIPDSQWNGTSRPQSPFTWGKAAALCQVICTK
jgi:hypothetical protein